MFVGKYVVMPAERSAGALISGVCTPQKLWMIVREQNNNKHILQENDIIKLGRYKLRVKQIVSQGYKREDQQNPQDIPPLKLDEGEPPMSFVAAKYINPKP